MTNDAPSDPALVAAARAGDRAALGLLLARHYPSALRLCRRLLGAAEAQDVAQEAALQALLSLDRLQEPARFGAWLHAIAANLARMSLRRRRPLSLDALSERAELVAWPRAAPTPEAIHEARELHDAIVAALAELPAHEREAAIGFFLAGYSYAELAELLGVPLSTVKGRLFKGRRKLQRRLGPLVGETLRPKHRPRKELHMSDDTPVEVTIDSIRVSLMTQHRVVVLRERGGGRFLPIWIGAHEADAIALALQGQQPQRPMTHDLALRLLAPLGGQVRRVTVSRIHENTFFAEIVVEAGGATHTVDARPSDALALAVRADVPIFVAPAVMTMAATAEAPAEQPTESDGASVIMEQVPGGAVPPDMWATLSYLYSFLEADESVLGLRLARVTWAERFPAQELAWQGGQVQAVRLQDGEQPSWLLLPSERWEVLTRVAQQVIDRERQLLDAIRQERKPEA